MHHRSMHPPLDERGGFRRHAPAPTAARSTVLGLVALLLAIALSGCGGSSSPSGTPPAPATGTPSGPAAGTPAAAVAGTASVAATSTPPPLSTSTAPWPAPTDVLPHITAAGLPALGGEQLAYHVHAHLDVVIDGNPQVVPANIGIDFQRSLISPLHTHDATGIIHIESARPATFTLGQFFTEWGVRLSAQCVGAYCDGPNQPVRFYVDGKQWDGDPRAIQLSAHEEIAIVIGPQGEVPSSYAFPPGD